MRSKASSSSTSSRNKSSSDPCSDKFCRSMTVIRPVKECFCTAPDHQTYHLDDRLSAFSERVPEKCTRYQKSSTVQMKAKLIDLSSLFPILSFFSTYRKAYGSGDIHEKAGVRYFKHIMSKSAAASLASCLYLTSSSFHRPKSFLSPWKEVASHLLETYAASNIIDEIEESIKRIKQPSSLKPNENI